MAKMTDYDKINSEIWVSLVRISRCEQNDPENKLMREMLKTVINKWLIAYGSNHHIQTMLTVAKQYLLRTNQQLAVLVRHNSTKDLTTGQISRLKIIFPIDMLKLIVSYSVPHWNEICKADVDIIHCYLMLADLSIESIRQIHQSNPEGLEGAVWELMWVKKNIVLKNKIRAAIGLGGHILHMIYVTYHFHEIRYISRIDMAEVYELFTSCNWVKTKETIELFTEKNTHEPCNEKCRDAFSVHLRAWVHNLINYYMMVDINCYIKVNYPDSNEYATLPLPFIKKTLTHYRDRFIPKHIIKLFGTGVVVISPLTEARLKVLVSLIVGERRTISSITANTKYVKTKRERKKRIDNAIETVTPILAVTPMPAGAPMSAELVTRNNIGVCSYRSCAGASINIYDDVVYMIFTCKNGHKCLYHKTCGKKKTDRLCDICKEVIVTGNSVKNGQEHTLFYNKASEIISTDTNDPKFDNADSPKFDNEDKSVSVAVNEPTNMSLSVNVCSVVAAPLCLSIKSIKPFIPKSWDGVKKKELSSVSIDRKKKQRKPPRAKPLAKFLAEPLVPSSPVITWNTRNRASDTPLYDYKHSPVVPPAVTIKSSAHALPVKTGTLNAAAKPFSFDNTAKTLSLSAAAAPYIPKQQLPVLIVCSHCKKALGLHAIAADIMICEGCKRKISKERDRRYSF